MKALHQYLLLGLSIVMVSSCEGFFGKKTNTDFLDIPLYDNRTVAYVPIQPVIGGLSYPVDIIAGWDELIYVADGGTEQIISYDQAGNEISRFGVPGLKAIAQTRELDILATGIKDTVINQVARKLPAIYRIDLNTKGPYGLSNARIVNTIVHPFYFKSGTPTSSDEQVSFEGISVLHDNRYYVSRNGSSNDNNQFGGPDDAVIIFNAVDVYQSPIVINTSLGLFNNFFKSPKGISTFAVPPQSPAVNRNGHFISTSSDPNNNLSVQVIDRIETDFGASFQVRNLSPLDTTKAERVLYEPGRFSAAIDVAVAGDGTNYFWVADALKDSVFQFNALGYEGVNPPSGLSSNKVIKVSFGGRGQSLTQFHEPRAIAYLNRILYVADAQNGRILRFKLSTDFE